MIRCSCGNPLVSVEAICELCDVAIRPLMTSSPRRTPDLASLVRRLANIYTVDTDQFALIALVEEAKRIVRQLDEQLARRWS